ncbi:MAG TPA: MFS transporter [Ktedonobacterales bacterium]
MLGEPITQPDESPAQMRSAALGTTELDPTAPGAESPAEKSGERKASRGGFFAPVRLASFRRLIAGQTISRLGDQFYFLAIPWLVLRITPSPAQLALVLGAASAALGVFTLAGGVLADRLGPRKLMMTADLARLVVVAALAALALWVTVPPLWSIIALSALVGVLSGLFYPASGAMIPHLVPERDLQAANSYEQLTMQSSNFVGPAIAGAVLSATRLAFGFVIDAASFAVSVLTLAFVRMPPRSVETTRAAKPEGGMASLGTALRFLLRTRLLLIFLVVSLLANFAVNGLFEVALPLLLKARVGLALGPQAQGIVIGGFGLGAVLGALAAGVMSHIGRKPLVGTLLFIPFAVLVAVIPLMSGVWAMAAVFAVMGLFNAAGNVLIITVMQRFVPLDMMGRMSSFIMLGTVVGTPLSIFVYGAAAAVVPDVGWLFFGGALLMGLALLAATTNKVIWQAE